LAGAPEIDSRLSRLDELLALLEAVRERGRDAYDTEPDLADATRYRLQLAVQVCIDLAAHLVAASGRRIPDRYRDLFTDLRPTASTPRWRRGWARPRGFAT
jgi:uncharacterized protein YutE (UPF0331/DUF86 family)